MIISGALSNALKGIGGEYEINRVLGAFGCAAYIIGANAFVAWSLALGREFDLTAYCIAFPAGLGVAVGSIAGAVALKDRSVATAKATEARTVADPLHDTASLPREVIVTNPPDEPANVKEQP